MARAMFRYEVPLDGKEHAILLRGDPVCVANCVDGLEFWAEYSDDAITSTRFFRVFGTGHPVPDGAAYVGTAPRINGFVWHLYELKGKS